ncbi:LOW QUALITY PROTEIN: endoglin [Anableps anableps]
MEGYLMRFTLILCITYATASSNQTCQPHQQSIYMREMLMGCWTDFVREDKAEVHILKLIWDKVIKIIAIFTLNLNVSKPVILIIASSEKASGLYQLSKEVKVYANNFQITLFGNEHQNNTYKDEVPHQNEELVKWAVQKFGGVTSFTTVKYLRQIMLTEAQGTKSGSLSCVLQNEDVAQKHFLKIEADPEGIKSCTLKPQNTGHDEVHVINIPEDSTVRNVSLLVKTQGTSLFLRGPQGTTWTFLGTEHLKLGSNNDIHLLQVQVKFKPPKYTGTLRGDKAEDVQKMALEYFKVNYFTSYSEVTLNASTIFLVIGNQHNLSEGSPTAKVITEKSMIPITTNAPNQMPLTIQLYSSPDYCIPLDPETRLQTNKRIYAEISGNTIGGVSLTLKVNRCIMCSKASTSVKKELPFILEACSRGVCNNSARLSFSLDQLQEATSTTWDIQCSIDLCYNENCVYAGEVWRNLEVMQSCQPMDQPCFDFGLPGVLGIAFGGFLIGVLLIGALWFIKIKTGYPSGLDMRSTAAGFPGCPCSRAKRQRSSNPSPSDSSANASIGSTQSTPPAAWHKLIVGYTSRATITPMSS